MNTCIYCNRVAKSKVSNQQHEIRCHQNPDKIIVSSGKSRIAHIDPTPCLFCGSVFSSKNSLNNHTIRCPANPDRKLQTITLAGKISSKEKYTKWAATYWTQDRRNERSIKMKAAVEKNPESYTSSNRGRTKQIEYNGIKFQGQWELDFYKWCNNNNVRCERSKNWFPYEWNGSRKYNPDFYLPDLNRYVEVKGYETERDRRKWLQFPEDLVIIKAKEIASIRKGTYSLPG